VAAGLLFIDPVLFNSFREKCPACRACHIDVFIGICFPFDFDVACDFMGVPFQESKRILYEKSFFD
jgi:hypothetical protein